MRVLACVALFFLIGCAPRTLKLALELSHLDATYTPSTGDSMAGPLAEVESRLVAMGITVEDVPPEMPVFGQASLEHRIVRVRRSLPINGQFEVITHEAGHLFQPPALRDTEVGQLFAELVGVGIQKFYGSKTAERTAALYLAHFKWTFPSERHLRRDIQYAVRVMTGQLPIPVLHARPRS